MSGHDVKDEIEVDVLVVGSGPLGATFARKLYEKGRSIFMIDAGAQLSKIPGWHLKNSFFYQRNVNQFTGVVDGHLHTLSVPPDSSAASTLDPGAFTFDRDKYKGFVSNNQNPEQDPFVNLPKAAATYAVGGMATHWTACTPREYPTERSSLIDSSTWDLLYKEAENLLHTNQNMFDDTKINEPGGGAPGGITHFIRNHLVRDTLRKVYPDLEGDAAPQYLPLAGVRRKDAPEYITWSGVDTVLGETMLAELKEEDKFKLKEMWQCRKLHYSGTGQGKQKVEYAVVRDLLEKKDYRIKAKTFVIAAGAVLTPQILFNSKISLPALGRYLCEQPLAFCQVVLLQSIVDSIEKNPAWKSIVDAFRKKHPNDPIPIPYMDPEPQCWIPVSENRPWHCQVHRDSFSYGGVVPNVDTRLIVDLRWFGKMTPSYDNYVSFASMSDNRDTFGMPQPTFHVKLSDDDAKLSHKMMEDMLVAAGSLGGFLPGSEPSFQELGQSLHITGTCRMGTSTADSVVDTRSKVWGFDNLYLGTCGVIPTGNASNPTLTAMAIAIHACDSIE